MDLSTEGLEGLALALGRQDGGVRVELAQDVSELVRNVQSAVEQAQREAAQLRVIHELLSGCRGLAFDALNTPDGVARTAIQGQLREVLRRIDGIAAGRALAQLDVSSTKGAVAAVADIERALAEVSRQQWRLDEFQKRKLSETAGVLLHQLEFRQVRQEVQPLDLVDRAILCIERGTAADLLEAQLAIHDLGKSAVPGAANQGEKLVQLCGYCLECIGRGVRSEEWEAGKALRELRTGLERKMSALRA